MRKILFFSRIICLLFFPTMIFGQSLKRQSVSCYGTSTSTGNVYISQTVGQTYSTETAEQEKPNLIQGFQQSGSFYLEKISEQETEFLEIEVFPNPTKHSVTITTNEEIQTGHLYVFNTEGKTFVKKDINSLSSLRLECESWENGIYFIKVSDNNQKQQTLKLIISK